MKILLTLSLFILFTTCNNRKVKTNTASNNSEYVVSQIDTSTNNTESETNVEIDDNAIYTSYQGVVNEQGTIIIPFDYDEIHVDTQDAILIQKNGLWGLFNHKGKQLTDFEYKQIDLFAENPGCIVTTASKEEKKGAINKYGKIAIPFIYDNIILSPTGLASTSLDGKYGVIDHSGKVILPFEYEMIGNIYKDIIIIYLIQKEYKAGAIDMTGNEIIPLRYSYIGDFYGDFAVVCRDGKYGIINKKGIEVMGCNHDYIKPQIFKDRIIAKSNGIWILIKARGGFYAGSTYDDIKFSQYSYYPAKKNGKWGLITLSGYPLINYIYDDIEINIDNRMTVQKDEQYGIVDTLGRQITPCIYDKISDYKEGYAVVKRKNYGVIDLLGNEVIPTDYDYISDCSGGLFSASLNARASVLNKKGETLIQSEYNSISKFQNGLAIVVKNGKYGVINRLNEEIIPCAEQTIRHYPNEHLFLITKRIKIGE